MKSLRKIFLIILIPVFCFTFFSLKTHGQGINDSRFTSVGENDIILKSVPEFPKSQELVTVRLTSYAINLNRLQITWFLNGIVKKSGTGATSFDFINGSTGQNTQIDVYIQISSDNIVKKSAVFAYSDLDLVWEAIDSYVPPFSKLRRLPARESVLKIVAIPDSSNISIDDLEKDLVYTWYKNNKRENLFSGYGKNTFLMRNDLLSEKERVRVSVLDTSGNQKGDETINVDFFQPETIIYRVKEGKKFLIDDYLSYNKNDGPLTLIAEPYFYSAKPFTVNFLDFTWNVNGEIFKNIEPNYNVINLDLEEGQSVLQLKVDNQQKILQNSENKKVIIDTTN